MPTDRVSCAMVARDLGEELGGTAVETTGWIAVEHAGPWTPRAPTRAELGHAVDQLDALDDVRLQLIRPVRPTNAGRRIRRGHTVLLGHAGIPPSERWLRRVHLEQIDELRDLDPAVTLSATPPDLGEPVEHDVWLVCTHARRDACCAVHGRPAALALAAADVEVWETTHTGGHRFAATAIVLPDGLSVGRLDTVDIVRAATELADGHLDVELLRGRCAAPQPAQAAEVALRRMLGTDTRDAVLPIGVDDAGTVQLLAGPDRWAATVTSAPAAEERPVSDDGTRKRPTVHEVTALTKLD